MKLHFSLLFHLLIGAGIGWLDRATSHTAAKRREWLLRQAPIVQYLVSMVFVLGCTIAFYDEYAVHRPLLYSPLFALAMLLGMQAIRLIGDFVDRKPGEAEAVEEPEETAETDTESAPTSPREVELTPTEEPQPRPMDRLKDY